MNEEGESNTKDAQISSSAAVLNEKKEISNFLCSKVMADVNSGVSDSMLCSLNIAVSLCRVVKS